MSKHNNKNDWNKFYDKSNGYSEYAPFEDKGLKNFWCVDFLCNPNDFTVYFYIGNETYILNEADVANLDLDLMNLSPSDYQLVVLNHQPEKGL